MEINGIAHTQLTVNDLQRAIPSYEDVLGFMGMKAVAKAPNGLYMVGGRTAPGYYSVLFEDPDGVRLEVNFVTGKGHFEHSEQLPLKTMPGYEDYPA